MDKYWASQIADQVLIGRPGTITLATGITPSGPYHIGHLREMIITDALNDELVGRGVKTRFIYFIDDLDNLRKLYPFLPKSFARYVHYPICNIPSPEKSGETYAQYFLKPFEEALKKLGISVEFHYAHQYYQQGKMTSSITKALEKRDEIAEILSRVSGRKLPEDWQPFEPLDKTTGKIRGARILDVDTKNTRVRYLSENGKKYWADYSKGEGKLPWRIDWPARWALLDVAFEPFGKEHAAAGGSYDVGAEIAQKIYGKTAPEYVVYEHVYLKGEQKKMSASLGNLISLDEFLNVVPPAVARYFVLRSRNERHIVFDPGEGLMQLTDEFARLEQKVTAGQASTAEQSVYRLSQVTDEKVSIEVPFSHLVNVVQAAQGNIDEIQRLLKRTGHVASLKSDAELKEQVKRVKLWLKKYAPENIKFEILSNPPSLTLENKEEKMLQVVAHTVERGLVGIDLHNAIYEAGRAESLKPRETFALIYKIFLGKDSGPKAGFFLSMLEKDFVLQRLRHYTK